MKTCTKCQARLPLTEFHKDRTRRDGRQRACRQCVRTRDRKYRTANKEREIARVRAYRAANSESVAAQKREYQKANPEKIVSSGAVAYAIKTGKLARPHRCSKCGTECTPDAHHWSYLPEYRLDVSWLCRSCHKRIHFNKSKSA